MKEVKIEFFASCMHYRNVREAHATLDGIMAKWGMMINKSGTAPIFRVIGYNVEHCDFLARSVEFRVTILLEVDDQSETDDTHLFGSLPTGFTVSPQYTFHCFMFRRVFKDRERPLINDEAELQTERPEDWEGLEDEQIFND